MHRRITWQIAIASQPSAAINKTASGEGHAVVTAYWHFTRYLIFVGDRVLLFMHAVATVSLIKMQRSPTVAITMIIYCSD